MDTKRIAVLGSGQMGNGITQVVAVAGFDVIMIDLEQAYVDRGMDSIERSLGKLVTKERMNQAEADGARGRISTSTDIGACGAVDLVIEAIPEIPELKFSTFTELDRICPAHTILASNTSSISITEIAAYHLTTREGDRHALHESRSIDEARRGHQRRSHLGSDQRNGGRHLRENG